jgi:hypothetical protein
MGAKELYKKKIRELTRFNLKALPNDPRIDELMQAYLKKLRSSLRKSQRNTGHVPGAAVMVRKGHQLVIFAVTVMPTSKPDRR